MLTNELVEIAIAYLQCVHPYVYVGDQVVYSREAVQVAPPTEGGLPHTHSQRAKTISALELIERLIKELEKQHAN